MAFQMTYDEADTNLQSWHRILSNMSRKSTPFINMIGKTKALATLHQWPCDAYDAASANARMEGYTPGFNKLTARTKEANYCQILARDWQVTDTQQAVSHAGVKSESSIQRAKKLVALLRDTEYAYMRNGAANAGASSTTGRVMKGWASFITTNTAANSAKTAGSGVQETALLTQMQNVWTNANGEAHKLRLFTGAYEGSVMGDWVTSARPNAVDGRKLSHYIQVYESTYGTVAVLKSDVQAKMDVYGIMSKTFKRAIMRPMHHTNSPKTGSFVGGWWEAEETGMCLWEKANFRILSCASAAA